MSKNKKSPSLKVLKRMGVWGKEKFFQEFFLPPRHILPFLFLFLKNKELAKNIIANDNHNRRRNFCDNLIKIKGNT